MKKGIIPICLACMLLVSMCNRDTGGDHGAVNSNKDSEHEDSYTHEHSSRHRKSLPEDGPGIRKTTRRPAAPERTGRGDTTENVVDTSSKKAGDTQSDAAVAPKTNTSNENREPAPGALLDKPRVDVPDVK